MKLSGWGRYPVVDCRVEQFGGQPDLPYLLHGAPTLIARGNGRSYGDAAVNADLTLSMLGTNRILAFDDETGLLTCEAGVLLDDILREFVPRGWFPPVVPGTRFVTVGGLIAADVHGKNHHHAGTFGAYVESLTLAVASGEVLECSRTANAEILRATIGGMGLTGVILSATFRLMPIETAYLLQEVLPAGDLDEAMALFEASRDWPYSVAWIDTLARGAARPVHFEPFFFPLDRIGAWNRLYGRRGFVQYQCVLPKPQSRGVAALLERIAGAGQNSFLAVLKLLGPGRAGMLSFPMEGYTLALDFPLRDGTLELLDALDAVTHAHGGRVYLAKDACCTPERVRRGYPEWQAFSAVRATATGSAPRFTSSLSRRLAL